MSKKEAIKALREALEMADAESQSHAYRVGWMGSCIKRALADLDAPVADDESQESERT